MEDVGEQWHADSAHEIRYFCYFSELWRTLAVHSNNDCRSSFFGFFSRLGGASPSTADGAARCDEAGSINPGRRSPPD